MNLDDLKSTYQQADVPTKDGDTLRAMTKLRQNPTFRRLRRRMYIQAAALLAFAIIAYPALDGYEKPWWAQLVMMGTLALYFIHELWGLIKLTPMGGAKTSLVQGLERTQHVVRVRAASTWVVSLLYGIGLMVFFGSTIEWNQTKVLGMAIMLVGIGVAAYQNAKHLRQQEKQISASIAELLA